jgi:hypothetical protein
VGKTFNYSRHLLRVQTHMKPALGQKLGPALKVIGHGLVTGLRAAGRFLNGFGPMRWVKQHPVLMFPMALVSGVTWGLMEGLAAQKLAKSKKMNNLLQSRLV